MSALSANIDKLMDAARHPARTVAAAMATKNQKAVGCFPVYVPEEIVHAAGFLPVGLWGGQTTLQRADAYMQSFGCTIVRANLELAMKGVYNMLSAIVVTAFCDTLKCSGLDMTLIMPGTPILPIVYPNNRGGEEGREFMMAEMNQLKERLEKVAGRAISESDLERSLAIYEDYHATKRRLVELVKDYPVTLNPKVRHLVLKASYFMDKEDYTAILKEILRELVKLPVEKKNGIKVVVTGILVEPEPLLDVFVDNNYTFVADDLAHQSRQFRTLLPAGGSAMERLVKRAMNQRGCAMLYDGGKSKGEVLLDLVRQNNADAVVVCMFKFCDPEGFDYPIYKKELEAAGVKMLYIEIEQQMESVEALRTRIQSFAEMF